MTTTRAALIARAQSLDLNTRECDEGLLCWWDDEDPDTLFPLLWDCPRDGIEAWLTFYAPLMAARRGIAASEPQPVPVAPAAPVAPVVGRGRKAAAVGQLSLFGETL